ncbi:lipoxygenase family protein [Altererythrobacter sp. ZODW24]|uniref:lipoxygenase family protein n=1 Tax=Altererythrobacter sp. ZODW24 TaxID=2185142 RepID=UPI000DF81EFE|nr:lipoxygenase family protein [Altererythrobacter sp. ZODW24]
MSSRTDMTINRRSLLGGMSLLPFAAAAKAQGTVSAVSAACAGGATGSIDPIYEYDFAGKPIEWSYPSGVAAPNGLTLKGLGLMRTGSKKDTSDPGFDDVENLASRFLNRDDQLEWHPASLWSLQLAAKAVGAVESDKDKVGLTSIADEYFAYQRVGGVNPCMIEKSSYDADFKDVMMAGTDFYIADYQSLDVLEDNDNCSDNPDHIEGQRQRYAYQPKALFTAEDGYLKPVAILIKRGANSAFVVPGDEAWEVAKFIVQNADVNYHQLVTHLGRTHLYVEAFAVATGKCLPRYIHPVSLLLRPHFEGTININDFATTDLINISPESEHGGVFDLNFAGTMASNVKLLAQETFGLYDQSALTRDPALAEKVSNLFNEGMFPRNIANRGVGHFRMERIGITDKEGAAVIGFDVCHTEPGNASGSGLDFHYPYLEDGCKLWNATADWIARYVNVHYADDDAVRNDCELQSWARTCMTEGQIQGLGEYQNGNTLSGAILTRSYLAQALTAIIFTGSVQHAAVNFPQADFGPSIPAGIYHDYFTDRSTDVSLYLPNEAHFKEVMQTLSVLACSQYTTLGKYHKNTSAAKRLRSVQDYFKNDAVKAPLKQFGKTLDGIEKEIKARGKDAHGNSYIYLRPSRIPQSTNV